MRAFLIFSALLLLLGAGGPVLDEHGAWPVLWALLLCLLGFLALS
jgi:hypothetical protein